MVRFDSWRADGFGNEGVRNLVTKPTKGGRATLQAVMRMKLEQASKAAMWTPTQRNHGEGRADREETGAGSRPEGNHRAPIRTTGVVSTACEEGKTASVGEARDGRGVASLNGIGKDVGPSGCRKGSDVPKKPGNAGGGKGPFFWSA